MKKVFSFLLSFIMVLAFSATALADNNETGKPAEVTEIATAEELIAINNDLAGNYVLTADIDLSAYDNFPMIGTYVMDENSEEGEDPVPEAAFTGSFDGNGHTISNLKIDASEDMNHFFGVGLFACVGEGGTIKNLSLRDIHVKGAMLVGGAVGYAFHCTIDNVDLGAADRNTVESTMVMAGGIIGGLTCSECINCDVENTDITAAPGGNSGILGGGFSKPVLENCTVRNSTITAVLGEVPMFGMTEGAWIGGLTGCVNLDGYNPTEWYVKNCSVTDTQITVSGKGSFIGGLTGSCGVVLADQNADRMLIQDCKVENVNISINDSIPCVGSFVGGSFSEGDTPHSFLIDRCKAEDVKIITDAENLGDRATGLLIGQSVNSQFMSAEGELLNITDLDISPETINSTCNVKILRGDGSEYSDAKIVGQIPTAVLDGVFPAIAGKNGTTYVSLFDVIISDQWTPVWEDYVAAVVGEDAAAEMTAGLQSAITSDLYGEAAEKAFADGGYAFNCDFINGAQSITFKDDTVTILKTDGNSETHTYEYMGQYNVGDGETMIYQGMEIPMAFPVDVYRSTDEAGEFNYFLLREDTMADTYHIEFRYGRDLKELQGYLVGPYAYWLAAGIDESADEDTIQKVIALFCLENMDYSAHTETALKQISDLGFVGAWQADLSSFGKEFADVELNMTIDEAGHGITVMNGEQTADFEAYAVDNDVKGDGKGIYVAFSNLEYEAEAAPFIMTVNDAGQTVLTLTAEDGTISWVKQAA